MSYLVGKTIGKIWFEYLNVVLKYGKEVDDDKGKIFEIPYILIEIDRPPISDEILNKYASPKIVQLYREKMRNKEIIPELQQSYGKRLYDQNGVNQVAWLIDRLKLKPTTKSATISLLLPNDSAVRIPCLTTIDAKIRDDRLVLTGTFRSQNVYHSYGNMIALLDLQQEISDKLEIERGILRLFVLSPHIYKSDIDAVLKILKEKNR